MLAEAVQHGPLCAVELAGIGDNRHDFALFGDQEPLEFRAPTAVSMLKAA